MKDNGHISNSVELKHRIMELNAQKYEQEEEIKRDVKELRYSLTPGNIIKDTISAAKGNVSENHDLQHDLVQRTLNVGLAYAIGKMFGRTTSLRGYATSLIAERVAEYIVKNNTGRIISGIGTLVTNIGKNKREEK